MVQKVMLKSVNLIHVKKHHKKAVLFMTETLISRAMRHLNIHLLISHSMARMMAVFVARILSAMGANQARSHLTNHQLSLRKRTMIILKRTHSANEMIFQSALMATLKMAAASHYHYRKSEAISLIANGQLLADLIALSHVLSDHKKRGVVACKAIMAQKAQEMAG